MHRRQFPTMDEPLPTPTEPQGSPPRRNALQRGLQLFIQSIFLSIVYILFVYAVRGA